MKIVIIDYGAGNIQSIKFAFQRLGYNAILSKDADEIMAADKVIFPGVGEAGIGNLPGDAINVSFFGRRRYTGPWYF